MSTLRRWDREGRRLTPERTISGRRHYDISKLIEVVILNQGEDADFKEDLAKDALEIINVFSARLYSSKSIKNQKLLDDINKAVGTLNGL